jgi:RimJ/RimL family protein N-acetyltransferase
MRSEHWPLFDLIVRTPRVELHYPNDDDVHALAELAARGIHDPTVMPFLFPWTDVAPPLQQRNTLQHYWSIRAQWQPSAWDLPFGVWADGALVGVQSAGAKDFPTLRTAGTGSWLGHSYQGKGLGTEMRAAILHLLFAGLDAVAATSGAFIDNPTSHAVSAKLGYEDNGSEYVIRRGERAQIRHYVLTRERWERQQPRADIEIVGLENCREMFGLTG